MEETDKIHITSRPASAGYLTYLWSAEHALSHSFFASFNVYRLPFPSFATYAVIHQAAVSD